MLVQSFVLIFYIVHVCYMPRRSHCLLVMLLIFVEGYHNRLKISLNLRKDNSGDQSIINCTIFLKHLASAQ